MRLYESKYLFVNYLEIQYLLHIKFKEEVLKIDTNTLKADFFVFFDEMVKRKARHFMIDTENIEHIFDTEFVSWFNRTIFPLIKSIKADKIAWLSLANSNFSIISSFLTSKNEKIEQKLFTKPDLAMKWLLEDGKRKKFRFAED